MHERRAIIVSISSDIGAQLGERWVKNGWEVAGTYRTMSPALYRLRDLGVELVPLDLNSSAEVDRAADVLNSRIGWERFVLAAGTQQPVGTFEQVKASDWESSVTTNFTRQFRLLGQCMNFRSRATNTRPVVLSFAGGGTNSAPTHYSAYTVSKIATIKMMELLAAEVSDTDFVSVGPGWVRTKIHQETVVAGELAGNNFHETMRRLSEDDFFSLDALIDKICLLLDGPFGAVSGRNYSARSDLIGSGALTRALHENPNLYTLRRFGNDWTP